MDTLLGFIPSLFSLLQDANPLRVLLQSLMVGLTDTLVRLATSVTSALFTATALDYSNPAFASIWAITTGVSAGAILILFVVGIAHGAFIARSFSRMPTVVGGAILAFVMPQVVFGLLPQVTHAFRLLAKGILDAAAPNLELALLRMAGLNAVETGTPGQASMDDVVYREVGMFAPLLLAVFLFGLLIILIVLWVLMAVEAFVFVTAPLAAIGLAGPPSTQAWFKRWLNAAFMTAFAPVPLALTIAIATALFAQSRPSESGNVFSALTVAVAGGVLLLGAFLAPMTGFALFKFAGDGISQGVGFDAHSRGLKSATSGAHQAASVKRSVDSLTNRKVKAQTSTETGNAAGSGGSPGAPTARAGKAGTPGGSPAAGASTAGASTGSSAAAGASSSSAAAGASSGAAVAGGPVGIAAVAAMEVAKKGKEQVAKVADHVMTQAEGLASGPGNTGDAGGSTPPAAAPPPQHRVESANEFPPAPPPPEMNPEPPANVMPPPPVRPKRTPVPPESTDSKDG